MSEKISINIKTLHRIYLEMFLEFHNFCESRGLCYYMVGGTLLGAVRESGFIPWDDDVDIAMPREDYERFAKEYNGAMCLKSTQLSEDYFLPYMKLVNGVTPIQHVYDKEFDADQSVLVAIDLYPIDGIGNDGERAASISKKISRKKYILYLNQTTHRSQNIVKRLILACIRFCPTGWIVRDIEKSMKRHSIATSKYWTRWREETSQNNFVSKDVFGTPVLLPFEGYEFYAPQKYGDYLEGVYGDYMEQKRENQGMRHSVDVNEVSAKMVRGISGQ